MSINKQNLNYRCKLLSQGSFVIACEADSLGEPYAIKISKYGYQETFKREIAALLSLHHPHIMHLVCCTDEGKQCSYLMELMDTSLSQMLEDTQLFLIRHVDVMLQI
jgi:serine/threonine protein kinase